MNIPNDCELIPCVICRMFRLTTKEEYVWLKNQSPEGVINPNRITMTCQNCVEKGNILQERDNLKFAVEQLNYQVKYLNDRVASLRSIRDDELLIDVSVDQLTNRFDSLQVSDDTCNSTVVNSVSQNITIAEDTHIPELYNSNDTSVWADTTSVFDEILTGLQDKHRDKSATATCPIISGKENANQISFISEEGNTLTSDVRGHQKSSSNAENPVLQTAATDKHGAYDSNIDTLVIGDCNIKHIKAHTRHARVFKALKPQSCIASMAETAQYLLTKRLKQAKQVILHAGVNDTRTKGSEEIKQSIITFSEIMKDLDKNLVVSGPIPFKSMSSETFSRVCALNSWLETRAEELGITFINNFDLFWGSKNLHQEDGRSLNALGSCVLSNNIHCNSLQRI